MRCGCFFALRPFCNGAEEASARMPGRIKKKRRKDEKRMYRYELHCHTVETSVCGKWRAADMVQRYFERGYAGICVTDHLHPKFLSKIDHGGDWQCCVDAFMKGYQETKAAAASLGMDAIFGIEIQFEEDKDKEYLLYGVDEQWLRENPWLCSMGHKAFYEKFHDQVLIIQAHPYRDNDGVFLDSVHGVEVVNRHPRSQNRNERTWALAKENPWLYRICGSDAHRFGDEARAAVIFEERISDSKALRKAILEKKYCLWHNETDPDGDIYTIENVCG